MKMSTIVKNTILTSTCFFLLNTSMFANNKLSTRKINGHSTVGIWAMVPLNNGIANVMVLSKNGRSALHSFNCNKDTANDTYTSNYTIVDNGKAINFKSISEEIKLNVLYFGKGAMELEQRINGTDFSLKFKYVKVKKVSPLCFLYNKPVEKEPLPFKGSEFISNPFVPDNANIERYIGRWADKNRNVVIEIGRDQNGYIKLHSMSSENWNYLYNDVFWLDDELHYKSYSYSNKSSLFNHAHHKSTIQNLLTPVEDITKIKHSFFIGKKRFDYLLTKL